jgi:hypothetical protein
MLLVCLKHLLIFFSKFCDIENFANFSKMNPKKKN